jgi:peptide/nickel transport system permease protein
MNILPGDPVYAIADPTITPPEQIEAIRHQLGMDKPLSEQFFEYMKNFISGDFGRSRQTGERITDMLFGNFPKTLQLSVFALIVSIALGITLGMVAAIFRGKWPDALIRVFSLLTASMPTFWTGILLLLVFSIKYQWFPAMGSDGFKTLILPGMTLGLISSGMIIRMVRNSALDVISEQFIITLRAKGMPERIVMLKHVLRNVLIPTITIIGMQVANMLSGAVIVETIFSRRGVGRMVSTALLARDVPVVQGAVFFMSMVCVAANFLVDVSYAIIDPRVRKNRLS